MKLKRNAQTNGSKNVDVWELAEALNLSDRRIQQLSRKPNGLPKTGRGRYPLDKCFDWYIRYLQNLLMERSLTPDGEPTLAAVRLRRETAEAGLKEMQLADARRSLIAVEDVDRLKDELITSARVRLQEASTRISAQIVGVDSQVIAQSIVEKHIRKALAELATG